MFVVLWGFSSRLKIRCVSIDYCFVVCLFVVDVYHPVVKVLSLGGSFLPALEVRLGKARRLASSAEVFGRGTAPPDVEPWQRWKALGLVAWLGK